MGDKIKFDILALISENVSWRVFELECMEKYFGLSQFGKPEGTNINQALSCGADYIYWKLHTESTSEAALRKCCTVAEETTKQTGVKHINDPRGWINCHAKEKAFEIWKREGIPCPEWFEFKSVTTFLDNATFSYPMLLRLNNSTSGWFSCLCHNELQVREAVTKLQTASHYHHDNIPSEGVDRKLIAVQFIPTLRPENVIMSFRIIVAGNKVVTGYARLGSCSEWIAITNRFEPWMEELFVKYQKVCQDFCEENEELIVKSVKCLGLNFQGVDVILDQNDNPYFIEVQPGFSVGYAHRSGWRPPFYNPTRPDSLRTFLLNNLDRLKEEIPMYANYWLDKYNMFDKAFKALKEDLG